MTDEAKKGGGSGVTPAEQGQERRVWTIHVCLACGFMVSDVLASNCPQCIDGVTDEVEVVPASDLEIAQRFCDEVVDELARVREELAGQERSADELGARLRRATENAEAAETARDEAEKERDELLVRLDPYSPPGATHRLSQAVQNTHKRRADEAEKREKALATVLRKIADGSLHTIECVTCACDRYEALTALDQSGKGARR